MAFINLTSIKSNKNKPSFLSLTPSALHELASAPLCSPTSYHPPCALLSGSAERFKVLATVLAGACSILR